MSLRPPSAGPAVNGPPGRRLLFLLPFAPRLDAAHGGSRTMAQLLLALGGRHRIALLYLRGPDEPQVDDAVHACCELVEEVARGSGNSLAERCVQRASVVRSRLKGNPAWVAYWAVRSYETRVRTLAYEWQPDVIQIEYHVMGQYARTLSGCAAPRVLVQHEPGAAAARNRGQSRRGFGKLKSALEVRAWERYEQAIMRQVQAIVVFTERDRKALEPLAGGARIVRIPIGTMLPNQPLNPLGSHPPSLLFVGNFVHPPNTEAAVRLIESIFPRVRKQFPDVVLYVVGEGPPEPVRKLAGENVIITGRVADTSPYLDRAAVIVVPLRIGGGMRVKVLEALGAGKAVVASPLAVEGLDVSHEEQVVLAETDQQFCEAIADLLRHPERRAGLAQRARDWACANLTWGKSIAAYEQMYNSLINRHDSGRTLPV